MRLAIDTDSPRLTVEGDRGTREVALYSAEAFSILSELWLKMGWALKHSYRFTWFGRPVIQLPDDLLRIQEVIYRVRPDVLIETGVAHGGSLVFYASLFKAMGSGLLQRVTQYCVVDVEDRQPIEPRCVYLAPADYHLLVERGRFSLSTEEAVAFSRPSIDVLFESAADAYRQRLIGVILTGANQDGAHGIQRIKQRGGVTIVQDPATAEAPAMPQAAISTARVDRILPLDRIGPFLVEVCRAPSSLPTPARR